MYVVRIRHVYVTCMPMCIRQTDRQTDRQTHSVTQVQHMTEKLNFKRQTDRQTDENRQTDRLTQSPSCCCVCVHQPKRSVGTAELRGHQAARETVRRRICRQRQAWHPWRCRHTAILCIYVCVCVYVCICRQKQALHP
jgi:hypothetical protein